MAREYGLYHNDHGAMRETFKTSKTSCLPSCLTIIFRLVYCEMFLAVAILLPLSACLAGGNSTLYSLY